MTRFAADTSEDRQALVRDAVRAHRERGSAFCTLEADEAVDGAPPWVQFADGTLNVDCTEAELARLNDLLRRFPSCTVTGREDPEDMPGINVRIEVRADDGRLAEFVDRLFVVVFDLPEDCRVWAVEI